MNPFPRGQDEPEALAVDELRRLVNLLRTKLAEALALADSIEREIDV